MGEKVRQKITARILAEARIDERVAAALETIATPDGAELIAGIADLLEQEPEWHWTAHIEAVVAEKVESLA